MASYYKPVNESITISATADKSITGFVWKHTPSKGLANIDSAALYMWNHGGIVNGKSKGDEAQTTFESLTRSEKLKLIEDYLKNAYIGIAKQQSIDTAIETARIAAIASSESDFELTNGV